MVLQETRVGRVRATPAVAVAGVVESTVTGMGYDLADCEVVQRGRLIRVFIDLLEAPGAGRRSDAERAAGALAASPKPLSPQVTVEDCERVTRQLQRVLEVEGIDYGRLEVSSPGLDRVLRTPAQFRRFAGEEIEVRLRVPVEGRRRFVGLLLEADDKGVELSVEGARRQFRLADLEKARLVPKF